MNRTVWIVLIIVVLAIAGWLLFRNGGYKTTTPSTNTNTATPTSSSAVSIENMSFVPQSVTVAKGTTVTWTNNDSVGHTVTESDGKTGPKSATLGKGETYSFTYDTAGTFAYKCSIHPSMTGTVIVTP